MDKEPPIEFFFSENNLSNDMRKQNLWNLLGGTQQRWTRKITGRKSKRRSLYSQGRERDETENQKRYVR